MTRAVAETQVPLNVNSGNNSSSSESSVSASPAVAVRPSLDFSLTYLPFQVTASTASGGSSHHHGHHHSHAHAHSHSHNHNHPSVIHEGHSESGKINLSQEESDASVSGQIHLDSNVDQSVVTSTATGSSNSGGTTESVDLSTGGNSTNTNTNNNSSSTITQQVSNPEIKIEKESPMHQSEETKQVNSNGKSSTSSSVDSVTDAIKSDCNDNGCQSSAATESKSDVNSSAVTPASS